MDFRINGCAVAVDVDLRTSLLDLLRDHLGLTGSKKGCNQGACGACTVLVDGERINACLALAVQYQGREITTVEGLADGDGLHRCRRRSSRTTASSAAIARRGRSARRSPWPRELERGVPSARHRRPRRREHRPHPRRAARAHERQPLPLRRPQRHRGGDRRVLCGKDRATGVARPQRGADSQGEGRMTPFTYSRATDSTAAVREAAQAGARYLGGGTNLVDLMREGVERPSSLVDVTGLDGTITERADGGLRIGGGDHEHRAGRGPAGALSLSDADARHRGGRVGADPQHGDGRRQPAAAHALPLLLRRCRTLQQTRAGRGLRRAGRLQPHARHSWRLGRLRGDPSLRHVRGAGRARRDGASRGRRTARARCRSRRCTGCRATRPIARPSSGPAS